MEFWALSDQEFATTARLWQGTSGHRFTPLGQGGGAGLLEKFAAVEVAVLIEVAVSRSMDGGKILQVHVALELRHRPLSPSDRLV